MKTKRPKNRTIKPFDELTITDDFMFGAVMSDPKNLKPLLELVLGLKIANITYPERQKTIDLNYPAKGVRLDLYCEDDKKTVYSVEIQTTDEKNLPRRIRYYRGMIDLNVLDRGGKYKDLKKSVVIFICTFDYFEKGRYIYTFKNQCQEDETVYLNDETTSIVLNVNGTIGEINEELKDALQYMSGRKPAGDYAESLDDAVKKVKANEKWRIDYMSLTMRIDEAKEIADLNRVVSVLKKLRKILTKEELASALDLDLFQLNNILDAIDANPDKTDWEIAEIIYG